MKWALFIILFFPVFGFSCSALRNDSFFLQGKIISQKEGYIHLLYTNIENKEVDDSCRLQNGNFSFKGNISEPTLAFLKGNITSISDDDSNSTSFYLEPKWLSVIVEKNHFKEVKITGSRTQNEKEILEKRIAAIVTEPDSIQEKIAFLCYNFIRSHSGSYVSAFELAIYSSNWSLDTIMNLYHQLKPAIQNSFYGKEVKATIDKISNGSIGKMAIDFVSKEFNGNILRLSDLKDKYVLLDFWATWCVPCRKGMPHLIKIFEKYHAKGLEIIGIAEDDHQPQAWEQVVRKEGIGIWHNVLSGALINKNNEIGRSSLINDKYGVQLLPTRILIDKSGKIVGRYMGSDDTELDKQLAELIQ